MQPIRCIFYICNHKVAHNHFNLLPMALSPAEMQEAIIQNLPSKTGKTLIEWIELAKSFNLEKNSEIVAKLKTDFQLGHVQAQTIVWRLNGDKPYLETAGYEEQIFKQTFKQYQTIKTLLLALDAGISAKPCKTYVPFYKKLQFALLTEKNGQLMLGLHLPEPLFPELPRAHRLSGSNRINRMVEITHTDWTTLQPYLLEAIKLAHA